MPSPTFHITRRPYARDRMFAALESGDRSEFSTWAKQFGVTHVLARGSQARAIATHTDAQLELAFEIDELAIFSVSE